MLPFLESQKGNFQQIIEHFKKELLGFRTSRANPNLVENILVESYGAKTPLKQLANITAPEARLILIQLWDKTIIKEVEKAIAKSNLNITPNVEGDLIRIILPPLTEENRKNIIKILNQRLEQSKLEIRNIRDKIKKDITAKFAEKEINENVKYKSIEELDKLVQSYNEEIKELGDEKCDEIMKI